MSLDLVLGIDAGCYGVKVVGAKGEGYFPSHVMVRPKDLMNFGGAFKSQSTFDLTIGEDRYILGDHAVRLDKRKKRGLDENNAGTKNTEAAFVRAIGAICEYIDRYEKFDEEEVNVYCTFGSPIIRATQPSEVEEIEQRFKVEEGHHVVYNDHPFTIYIKEVLVLPEGAAAILAQDFNPDQVYIVDAGSETINLASMYQSAPVETETASLDDGVEYYKRSFGEDAAYHIARKVNSQAQSLDWDEGATLYICGGFSSEIGTEFNALDNVKYRMEVIKPELALTRKSKSLDPSFANAIGMYFIAREAFNTEIKKG